MGDDGLLHLTTLYRLDLDLRPHARTALTARFEEGTVLHPSPLVPCSVCTAAPTVTHLPILSTLRIFLPFIMRVGVVGMPFAAYVSSTRSLNSLGTITTRLSVS